MAGYKVWAEKSKPMATLVWPAVSDLTTVTERLSVIVTSYCCVTSPHANSAHLYTTYTHFITRKNRAITALKNPIVQKCKKLTCYFYSSSFLCKYYYVIMATEEFPLNFQSRKKKMLKYILYKNITYIYVLFPTPVLKKNINTIVLLFTM